MWLFYKLLISISVHFFSCLIFLKSFCSLVAETNSALLLPSLKMVSGICLLDWGIKLALSCLGLLVLSSAVHTLRADSGELPLFNVINSVSVSLELHRIYFPYTVKLRQSPISQAGDLTVALYRHRNLVLVASLALFCWAAWASLWRMSNIGCSQVLILLPVSSGELALASIGPRSLRLTTTDSLMVRLLAVLPSLSLTLSVGIQVNCHKCIVYYSGHSYHCSSLAITITRWHYLKLLLANQCSLSSLVYSHYNSDMPWSREYQPVNWVNGIIRIVHPLRDISTVVCSWFW